MKILKTLLFAPLAVLISMPAYAHDYRGEGYSHYDKRIEHRHKKSHRKHHHDRGHHYGLHKKPYGLYKKHHGWHEKPIYGYHRHGYGFIDNDGWELILRLSDDF